MTAISSTAAGSARMASLDDLDRCWGEAYDLAVTSAGWVAKRLEDGFAVVADSPSKLHAMLTATGEA